jgi:hypothetical protein
MAYDSDDKLSKYWNDEMTSLQKHNFISKNHFWSGLSEFNYKYIPKDVREKLWLKLPKNGK